MKFEALYSCVHNRQVLSRGDIVESFSNLSEKYPDRFRRVCKIQAEQPEEAPEMLKQDTDIGLENSGDVALFEIVHKGRGWYNVINAETNEVMNGSRLRKKEAEELIANLEDQSDIDPYEE